MTEIITDNDLYAYMFREKGLTGRTFKMLCKLNMNFEDLFDTDFDTLLLNNLTSDNPIEIPEEKVFIKLRKITEDVIKEKVFLKEKAELFFTDLINKGIFWTHLDRNDYPQRLGSIEDPPLILFYRGKLPDENRPCVAIVGARECSPYGEKAARMFARELSVNGVQIISGMARGIDGISQRNSIAVDGSTFGVLGCGVDVIYPKENEDIFDGILKNGGLISEFEPGTQPVRTYFPSRNRIISSLSDIVLVVEARKRSGTYITVTQALEQGREVFAVPGRITDALSDGCNNLIATGAGVAVSPNAILEELKKQRYSFIKSFAETETFNENERIKNTDSLEDRIIKLLANDDMSLDAIYQKLGDDYSVEELSISLVELEMDGKIVKTGSRYFMNP